MRHHKSTIEAYHIINRGVNDMTIFRNDEDKDKYLEIFKNGLKKYKVDVYAYCLMDNHYHLLLQTDIGKFDNISGLLRYTNSQYVRYFNVTDEVDKDGDPRAGTIFRGSYKSLPLDNMMQIEKTIAYIHNNPTPLTKDIETYEYSSYYRYLNVLSKKATAKEDNAGSIELQFSSMEHYTVEEFRKMTKESSKYKFCEGKESYIRKNYLTDQLLIDEIMARFNLDVHDIGYMEIQEKSRIIFEIDKIPGTSKKQLARVLRINYAELCRLIRTHISSLNKTQNGVNENEFKANSENMIINGNKMNDNIDKLDNVETNTERRDDSA